MKYPNITIIEQFLRSGELYSILLNIFLVNGDGHHSNEPERIETVRVAEGANLVEFESALAKCLLIVAVASVEEDFVDCLDDDLVAADDFDFDHIVYE